MQKPQSCFGCPIYSTGFSFSVPDGDGTSGITIIGEALGDEEAKDGLPFRPKAPSGSKLEEMFKLAEGDLLIPVRRNMFKLWNVIACQPPYGNKLEGMFYEKGAIDHCKRHFNKVVTGNDNIILALGNVPLKYLTTASGNASEKQSITYLRGYAFRSKYGLVIPSLHPSFVKRGNPDLTALLVEDLKKCIRAREGTYIHRWHPDFVKRNYNLHPSVEDVSSFYHHVKDNPKLILTYDIETPDTASIEEDDRDNLESNEILTVQFSYAKAMAINIPYKVGYIDWIDALFRLPNTKANQNTWQFDDPRLRAKGHKLEGRIHDLMWMFNHAYSGLPNNLQSEASIVDFPFPWKHLYKSNFEYYGCCDVDANQYLVHTLPKLMKARGVWDGYINQVYNIHPIMEAASDRGIPVNDTLRKELEIKLRERSKELFAELQIVIPNECKNLRPKRGTIKDGTLEYGYKIEPSAIRQLRYTYDLLLEKIPEGTKVVPFDKLVFKKLGLVELEFTINGEQVKRWCGYDEFNPSKEQLTKYIHWKRKELEASEILEDRELATLYTIPTKLDIDKETGERIEKETTGKRELEDMYYDTGDRVIEATIQYRSNQMAITNMIPNWAPSRDGYVHTTWGYRPPTGQFTSRQPNIQNCFSRDTEILTIKGWVRFDELPEGIEVAQYNHYNGDITFGVPIEYIKQSTDKILSIVTDEQIRLKLTKDHNCLIRNRRNGNLKYYHAKDYPKDAMQIQAGSLVKEGDSLNEYQVGFICALQADGSIVKSDRQVNPSIRFSFSKQRKIDRLKLILQELEIGYTIYHGKDDRCNRIPLTTFYIGVDEVPDWIPYDLLDTKTFGSWLLDYDSDTLRLFADEVFKWDGTYPMYYSTKKVNSDWVQILECCTGRRANLSKYTNMAGCKYWAVNTTTRDYSLTTNRTVDEIEYNDYTYCVSVMDGNIIVRTDNKVCITGNCSKHNPVGQDFRRIIEAPSGMIFAELDYKSYHVAMMGYRANDRDYIRFSQIDPHSIFTSRIMPSEWGPPIDMSKPDDYIRSRCAEIKKLCKQAKENDPLHGVDIRQSVSKPVVLGNQLGLGPKKLWKQNRRFIRDMGMGRELQAEIAGMFPKVELTKTEIREFAQTHKYLTNEFGYIQYFYEVFAWRYSKRRREFVRVNGSQSEQALAFAVQSPAFGMLKWNLLECEKLGYLEKYRFINSIHDSVMFLFHKSQLDNFIVDVVPVFTRPCRLLVNEATGLQGLRVGVELSIGRNWQYWSESNKDGMKEIKI